MLKSTVSLLLSAFLLSGCATIVNGSRQSVGINSTPGGAEIFVDDVSVGKTPALISVKRNDSKVVKLTYEGYQPYEVKLTRNVSGWIAGNILLGGLVGLVVDAVTGSMYKLSPDQIAAGLKKGDAYSSNKLKGDGIYLGVTLTPDPSWEKIGVAEKAK